jgi:predicted glutamine amidotransferase
MCGLFGGVGTTLDRRDKENIDLLGVLSKTRGEDSTGIFIVKRNSNKNKQAPAFTVRMHKDTLPSSVFLDTKMAKALKDDNPFVIAGHTRFATHGSIRTANAHPFSSGHYVGMHNGVIGDYFDKDGDLTDSAVLFDKINKDGVEKAIIDAVEAGGSMALVFLDKSRGTLNMFRNNTRPLFLGSVKNKKGTYYWASEKWMLDTLENAGMCSFTNIVSLKPDVLNTMKLSNLSVQTKEIKATPKAVVLPFLPTGYRPGIDRHADMAGFNRNDDGVDYERYSPPPTGLIRGALRSAPGVYLRSATEQPTVPGTTRSDVQAPSVQLTDDTLFNGIRYIGYKGLVMSVTEALKLTRSTECNCCTNHATSIIKPIYWLSPTSYVCNDCFDEVKDLLYREDEFSIGWVRRKDGRPFSAAKTIAPEDGEIPF